MELVKALFFFSSICLVLGNQDFVTRKEFKKVLSRLEIATGELVSTKAEMTETKAILSKAIVELTETKEELSVVKEELAETKAELSQIKAAYDEVHIKLDLLIGHKNLFKSEPSRSASIEERVEFLEELSKLNHARTCDELQAYGVTKSG